MTAYLLVFFSLFLSTLLETVSGHGFVHSVVIGGQTYPGWNPFSDPYNTPPPRVVRKIQSDGPVPDTDPNIACGIGGDTGTSAIASAAAGSQITFQWAYWPGDHQGPISTYMTSCNGDCSTFSANGAKWFKIDAAGYDPNTKQWAAAVLIANGMSWTSTIPAGLAPGQYLARHEIIALHSKPAQYYPSCSQITVTGTGTGVPSDSELVSMQTLYQGVTFPDIYGSSVSFTIPGPPVVQFDGSSPPPPPIPPTGTSSPTATSGGAPPTSTSASTPSSPSVPVQTCQLGSKKVMKRKTG
ncbi:glycosyl hydrolase family 61-domain-containing protein [Panaeolus papilionaceus]|nr:glycosyl hydrolase family 61-domain-containing protein [Panaeolus papilionaceus]